MTLEEAIKILQEKISPCVAGEWKESVDAAISALQAQEELYAYSQCKTCRYFHDYDVRCMIYDDYDVRCMICDDENDMYEEQEVKESGCTYKPDCPWHDDSKCNSPNDHRYHECDYDRGILPEDDSDELDEVMQHWIKQADEQEKVAEMYPEYADECKKISNDFRQLASWIRELKRLRTEVYFLKTERENTPVDLLGDVSCKTCRWKAETRGYVKGQLDAINDLVAAGLIEREKAFSMLKDHDLDEARKDTISRQSAINILSLSKRILGHLLDDMDAVDTDREKYSWGLRLIESDIKDVEELLFAQPEQRWIPVSEGLPEDCTEVFVYLFESPSPYIAWVENTRWNTEDFEVDREDEPIAWMPLPEPYRAKRRTDE